MDRLDAQHDDLRRRIAACEILADRLDAGELEPAALLAEVSALRRAFDAHNRHEEPLLLRDAAFDDHVEAHRAMGSGLAGETTAALRAVLAALRDHLRAEERGFLATRRTCVGDRASRKPCARPPRGSRRA